MDYKSFIDSLRSAENIILYGAQMVACGLYIAIKEVPGLSVKCFAVTDIGANLHTIDGLPVLPIAELTEYRENCMVVVAAAEPHHETIKTTLNEYGFNRQIYLDSQLEYIVMSQYYRKTKQFALLRDAAAHVPEKRVGNLDFIRIFMAKSRVDRPLKHLYSQPAWVVPVHAGAATSEVSIAAVNDNQGENISKKNRTYSELTVTYWVWKNVKAPYVGICHYRRIFILNECELNYIHSGEADVILSLPNIYLPDITEHQRRYISDSDWNAGMSALKKRSPEYFNASKELLKQRYIYNYNIVIAKKEVFNAYCAWMFPILELMETICQPKGIKRNDKYLGLFGEYLTALYFLYNRDHLKILHAEKKWLV